MLLLDLGPGRYGVGKGTFFYCMEFFTPNFKAVSSEDEAWEWEDVVEGCAEGGFRMVERVDGCVGVRKDSAEESKVSMKYHLLQGICLFVQIWKFQIALMQLTWGPFFSMCRI
jgi:hypothetical protein